MYHNTYFNTTGLEGEDLNLKKKKALSQQEKVERFFYQNPGDYLSCI